jgi:hypothetical protein
MMDMMFTSTRAGSILPGCVRLPREFSVRTCPNCVQPALESLLETILTSQTVVIY